MARHKSSGLAQSLKSGCLGSNKASPQTTILIRHLYRSAALDPHRACLGGRGFGNYAAPRANRRGFTLFELILALGLCGFVLLAIGMAIDLNLRLLDQRRGEIEQAQLARSVLAMIRDDLRCAVRPIPVDTTAIDGLLGAGALEGMDLEALGSELLGEEGNSGGNTSGSSSMSSQSSSGNSFAGLDEALPSDPEATGSTLDIAANAAPSAVIGIYGNSYQLQVDVSRLPRPDQYDRLIMGDDGLSLRDIPSDVKTVAYYLAPETMLVDDPTIDQEQAVEMPMMAGFGYGRGLVRRELDRSVTNWAVNNGDTQRLLDSGEIIAPEVVGLQFRYFDGTQWLQQWDSQTSESLPLAVEVTILLDSPDGSPVADWMVEGNFTLDPNSTSFYRIVVPILVAERPEDKDAQLEAELGL